MLNINLDLLKNTTEETKFNNAIASLQNPEYEKQMISLFTDLETEILEMSTESLADTQLILESVEIAEELESIKQYCTPDELAFLAELEV